MEAARTTVMLAGLGFWAMLPFPSPRGVLVQAAETAGSLLLPRPNSSTPRFRAIVCRGAAMVLKVLVVAEKPSVARGIADIVAPGSHSRVCHDRNCSLEFVLFHQLFSLRDCSVHLIIIIYCTNSP